MTWDMIREWYKNNRFFAAAESMREIQREWAGRETLLLDILSMYSRDGTALRASREIH